MSVRMCEICWRLNKERTNHVTLYEAALKSHNYLIKGHHNKLMRIYIYIYIYSRAVTEKLIFEL